MKLESVDADCPWGCGVSTEVPITVSVANTEEVDLDAAHFMIQSDIGKALDHALNCERAPK